MSTRRNKKRAPTHPGALLREVVLPELGITQAELADRLEYRADRHQAIKPQSNNAVE